MGRRKRVLPERTLAEVIEAYPAYRQSLLANFDDCRLSAMFGLEGGGKYTNDAQARGILFHRAAAKILREMRAKKIVKMPVERGLEILYEVCRQRDVPDHEVVLPSARERRTLRIVMIKFCYENEFGMKRLVDVEKRMSTTVTYPDPVTGEAVVRTITGQPDAILGNPPNEERRTAGATILDWKTTRKAPPEGPKRDGTKKGDHWDDPDHLSYHGYFQQRFYGLLGLITYPSLDFIELREFYPFEGVARYGMVTRNDMESLVEEFTTLVELLDRALRKGSESDLFVPSPGKHCGYCSAPTRCPLTAIDRAWEGGVGTWAEAKQLAAEYVQAKYVKDGAHDALKAWVEAHGPIPVKYAKARMELRWRNNKTGGGRTFGVWVPDESDRGPLGMQETAAAADEELTAAFDEIAERIDAQ